MIDSQKPGFEELYLAFYMFFQDRIRIDDSPWNKIKLQMMSQYFDDLALYKIINPIIVRIQSNPEDRRAIARAALWEALVAHQMGKLFSAATAPQSDQRFDMTPPPPRAVFTLEQAEPVTAASGITEIRIAKKPTKPKGKK